MTENSISYRRVQLSSEEISFFLKKVDYTFKPERLSKRVNIDTYSEKLAKLAHHYSCWDKDNLIGFCCYYINSPDAYFSIAAVDPAFGGKGIGSALLTGSIEKCKAQNCKSIEAEVNKYNLPSLKMINKLGFYIYKSTGDQHFIRLELK